MKTIIVTLSVIVLLTSACAKNSNQSELSSNSEKVPTALEINNKTVSDDLIGSYQVEKFISKNMDGDFKVTISGLTETREIYRDSKGTLLIKQKSVLNGCTREIESKFEASLESGTYSRQKFQTERCEGVCPVLLSGQFEGHPEKNTQELMGCKGVGPSDNREQGVLKIENNRLLFEPNVEVGAPSLLEINIKTK